VKAGNLVRIKRGGLSIPENTLGLLVFYSWMEHGVGTKIWSVSIIGPTRSGQERPLQRYLEEDLELIS
jgi:hypothetical protein